MWKRIGILGFSLLVGLLIFVSGGQMNANADNLDNYVTGEKGLAAPTEITEDGVGKVDADSDLYSGQGYVLTYNWGIKDGQPIKLGDTVTVQLPQTATYDNFITDPITVSLSGSDKSAGTMLLNPNNSQQMIITFNDNLAGTNTGRQGTIRIHVHGNKSGGTGGGSSASLVRKNGWPLPYGYDANGNPQRLVWQIVVNPDNKNLGDVTLTDQIGPYLKFYDIFDSDYPLSATTDAGSEDVSPDDIKASVSGSTMVIKLKNVTKQIDILYYTKIDSNYFTNFKWGNFSNSLALSSTSGGGDSTTTPGVADGVPANESVVKNYSWGATANINGWYLGGFQLTKTASDAQSKTLSGATYNLQKKSDAGDWEDYQTGLITNAEGVLKDPSLEPGTYRLIETAAPDGYLVNKTVSPKDAVDSPDGFTITAGETNPIHVLTQSDSPNGATLVKTDPSGKPVSGATYQLVTGTAEGADNDVVQGGLVTNSNGQVTVSHLAPGLYYFEETQAPKGYKKNTNPVQVTIKNTDTTVQSVSQSDEKIDSSSNSSNNSSNTSNSNSSDNSSDSNNSDSSDSTSNSSNSNTSSTSTSSTKAKRTTVANVASSNSSSNTPRNGGTAAGTTANTASKTAKHHTNGNSYLPRTNGQRSLLAMLVGFLILGLSLAASQWRRTHAK